MMVLTEVEKKKIKILIRDAKHRSLGKDRITRSPRRDNKKLPYFDLDTEFLENMYIEQEGRCCLTGVEFEFGKHKEYYSNPYTVSLDRIDSNKGYTRDNVRLVLWAVNAALSMFGDEVFDKVARGYLNNVGS